jgi:uncharacterized membrane protein (UPF0127 family)
MDFPVVHVDSDGNITEVVEETTPLKDLNLDLSESMVGRSIVEKLRAEGREEVAEEVEKVIGS